MHGAYYAEAGLLARIDNLGFFELYFVKDWNRIGEELKKAEVPMIVSKRRFVPGIYKYYKLEEVSRNGELMYLTPITSSASQNK